MSVTELPRHDDDRPPPPGYDRTPPQDIEAEQAVLGGMLLSKDAIADVVEVLRGHDFYRPAHETIYEAVLDLYGRGEPADPLTVADALKKSGELGRIGGAPYLHTLVNYVPTAANAGFYADIVRERAILRRLVEAGTRIVQMGYGGDGDADDIVDAAQAEVYNVTDARTSEDYLPLSDIMEGALDEIEAIGSRGGQMVGVPTGFVDLDSLTNGLHAGQMVVVAARPAVGKALALDTPLPTPTGWTTMGEVQVGNELIGAGGRPTRVVAATDVMVGRPCYEVEFSDGSVIIADAEHQWVTRTRAGSERRAGRVVTTEVMAATLRCSSADRRLNHTVELARPLDLPEAELPLPPYVLGAWLGGGDAEIAAHIEAEGPPVRPALRSMGVLGNRHIPSAYLRASSDQRMALLAGFLDAAGDIDESGGVQFSVTNEALAFDARELIHSLGFRTSLTTKRVGRRTEATSTAYVVTFTPHEKVFRLQRKLERQQFDHAPTSRMVVDVRPVPAVPVRCVEVDNDDHLYLAGESFIPTHNSTLGLDFARSAAIKHQMATVIFSLEMSRNEITMRLLSAEARVPLHHMRAGQMTDDDWNRIARRTGEVSSAPLYIDDSPNMTMMEIRAKCRRLKQRHNLKLVIVDYLQLMTSGKRVESRQQEVAEFSRALKLLAKELEVPVIAISQLNRGPEQRQDKKPMLSDLRESGCLPAATRVIRADSGAEVSLGELMASGERDVPVWALDESLRYVPRTMTHVFPSGRKPVFRMRMASGKEIEATPNHPFLTYGGWRPLGELEVGSRIATPRHVPAPLVPTPWPDNEVVLLAHLIGDSSVAHGQSKVIPAGVFSLPKRQVALFLQHLWVTDGSVTVNKARTGGRIYYASTSRRLVDDVARMLLRFGISTTVHTVNPDGVNRNQFTLDVSGRDEQLRFLRAIGCYGKREASCAELLGVLESVDENTNVDTVPKGVWRDVGEVLTQRVATHRPLAAAIDTQFSGSHDRLGQIAEVLGDADLEMYATNDISWDTVESIEPLGEQDVFDATVLGLHNFIANGVAVHNSIEQDADMVILMHREDAYEKESPRAGEADFIVAKHRNGPTATITVAFQGHYSRFVDMAQ